MEIGLGHPQVSAPPLAQALSLSSRLSIPAGKIQVTLKDLHTARKYGGLVSKRNPNINIKIAIAEVAY